MLVRKISAIKPWADFFKEDVSPSADSVPPIWAAREFMPRELDKGLISLFKVEDEQQAERIAAAFAFNEEGSVDAKRALFVSVSDEDMNKCGLILKETPGKLNNTFADARHVEVFVDSVSDVCKLALLFMGGNSIHVEGRSIGERARDAARNEEYDYLKPLNSSSTLSIKQMNYFLKQNVARVRGVPRS